MPQNEQESIEQSLSMLEKTVEELRQNTNLRRRSKHQIGIAIKKHEEAIIQIKQDLKKLNLTGDDFIKRFDSLEQKVNELLSRKQKRKQSIDTAINHSEKLEKDKMEIKPQIQSLIPDEESADDTKPIVNVTNLQIPSTQMPISQINKSLPETQQPVRLIRPKSNSTSEPISLSKLNLSGVATTAQHPLKATTATQTLSMAGNKLQNIGEGVSLSQQFVPTAKKENQPQQMRQNSPKNLSELDEAFLIAHREQNLAVSYALESNDLKNITKNLNESIAKLRKNFETLCENEKLIDLVKKDDEKECNFISDDGERALVNLKAVDGNQLSFTFLDENFTGVIKVQRKDNNGALKNETDVLRVYKGEIVDIVFAYPFPTKENCRIFDIARSKIFKDKSLEDKDNFEIYIREKSEIFEEPKHQENLEQKSTNEDSSKEGTFHQDNLARQRRNSKMNSREGIRQN